MVTSNWEGKERMTLADRLIHMQFRFELGMAKIGFYVGLVNMGLMLATYLTVKGISFPSWALIPLIVGLVTSLLVLGYYLEIYNVMGRLNSHMNTKANPEFMDLLATIDRLETKIDSIEAKLK
jgi:hypothetical protein